MLQSLMRWYAAQCDGKWEQRYGLSIETISPGPSPMGCWRFMSILRGHSGRSMALSLHSTMRRIWKNTIISLRNCKNKKVSF